MKKYKFVIGDLELCSTGKHLLDCNIHDTMNIDKWCTNDSGDRYKYIVAYWYKGKEGYDLHFVGNRPFSDEIDVHAFWRLAKLGQEMLDEEFRETDD